MSDDGALVARLYGAVPHILPQTAAAGEAFAVLRALECFTGPVTIASDNAAVVLSCDDLPRAVRTGKLLSGVYAAMARAGAEHRAAVHKVRGHQDPRNFPAGSRAWREAWGNQLADEAAGMGAGRHRFPQ